MGITVRKIDDLGRVLLPLEYRQGHCITSGDSLMIEDTGEGLLISPLTSRCRLCGSGKDVLTVDGIKVCRGCGEKLREAFR